MNQPDPPRYETVLDNKSRRVARVYAEALLDASDKRGQAAEVLEELETLVGDVLRRDPQLEQFLASAAVARERKSAAIHAAFEGRSSELLADFLNVLNNHDRLGALRAIVAACRDLFDRRLNRVRVRLRSAIPLAGDQRERLTGELRAAFGKEPVFDTYVDPSLIGGLVVQVDDWVYDASVRARLQAIRKQLVERSSYAIQNGRDRFCSQ